ncbi:unnamed protein product [Nesidiocoris tenuis]|nr:unnamed protein product [Nesidiocoris tenuis]CAB0011095.1 unnamed protein product [Nesidiocoris tenuis]
MDYFSERSNPFYDRQCNNEVVKMQRLSLDQLVNMTGLEYTLLHVQDPILYVIRKQLRHSPTSATALADYYIIGGTVYQAPDLASVINSRILSVVHNLQSAFDETSSYSRYHPSKGYSWELKTSDKPIKKEITKEELSSLFQRQRVDMLLMELTKKFPLPPLQPPPAANKGNSEGEIKTEPINVKTEKVDSPCMKPPPEKKPRLN